ncbi:MAG TPA: hypothetical protein VLC49_06565 [Solirubrobacteraceae bacterium]|nr:hypothetical protein [Solirubrobacteraceae bacterium]
MTERLRAGDSVDVEMPGGLEVPHGTRGRWAVTPVDRPGPKAGGSEVTLQDPDRTRSAGPVSITGTEDQVGFAQRCPGYRTIDSVDDQAVRGLEPAYRLLGQRAVAAVDRSRRIAQAGQATLQRPHGKGAMSASIAVAERDQLSARPRAAGN